MSILSAIALCFTSFVAIAGVESYRVEMVPDFESNSISGDTTITFRRERGQKSVEFALQGLVVDRVLIDGIPAQFQVVNQKLSIEFENKTSKNHVVHLLISYHGTPKRGLIFGDRFVYSAFDTCHWMICSEEPGERAPVELQIVLPKEFKVVASGQRTSAMPEGNRLVRHKWSETRPYPTYLFGFAAGDWDEVSEVIYDRTFKLLGAKQAIGDFKMCSSIAASAIQFFEKKSGVQFPHEEYTQVIVPGSEAQEVSSYSLLGTDVLKPLLKNPEEDWAIVHELAHQWWGNLLTCKSWSQFWLNEGITVFMTAAYKQERWGEAAYQRELDLARRRYQVAVEAGFDVPLSYSGPYPSLKIKRAVVYSKGALFMDALRRDLGDAVFWSGFKEYTKTYAGKSVESRDFQTIMESVSRRDLSELFDRWVY